jgi:hypothetical protein
MALESELQAALLLAAPSKLSNIRLFRRNVGTVRVGKRVMRFGIPGQCDLYALGRGGRHGEVELKAAAGSLKPEQRAWRDFCAAWGIPWIVLKAKLGEPVDQTIARWLTELSENFSSHFCR